eukprot:scaffold13712_cov34-Prasinocladus_malaysianus.AAC.1
MATTTTTTTARIMATTTGTTMTRAMLTAPTIAGVTVLAGVQARQRVGRPAGLLGGAVDGCLVPGPDRPPLRGPPLAGDCPEGGRGRPKALPARLGRVARLRLPQAGGCG